MFKPERDAKKIADTKDHTHISEVAKLFIGVEFEMAYNTLQPATYEEAKEAATRRTERRKARQTGKAPRYGLSTKPRKPLGFSGRKGKPLRAKPDRALAKWSKQVRERDDYTCQMTGVRDVQRNIAHHVAPRSQRPDLRLDVSNGITLTPEAHQKVHDNPVWARANGWLSTETYEAAQKGLKAA